MKVKLIDILLVEDNPGDVDLTREALEESKVKNNLSVAIDDLKARKIALKMELKVTGTIGILLKAFKLSLIEDPVEKVIDLKNAGFHISDNLINDLKRLSN